MPARIHPLADIEDGALIGDDTVIWRWTHVCSTARIGCHCIIGQGCYIGPGVTIGNRVRIQNNVSVYEGVTIDDDAFIGPSAVFTNVHLPKAMTKQRPAPTWIGRRAMIGANATIVCPVQVGMDAVVGAGSVVTKNVPDRATAWGVPAKVRR